MRRGRRLDIASRRRRRQFESQRATLVDGEALHPAARRTVIGRRALLRIVAHVEHAVRSDGQAAFVDTSLVVAVDRAVEGGFPALDDDRVARADLDVAVDIALAEKVDFDSLLRFDVLGVDGIAPIPGGATIVADLGNDLARVVDRQLVTCRRCDGDRRIGPGKNAGSLGHALAVAHNRGDVDRAAVGDRQLVDVGLRPDAHSQGFGVVGRTGAALGVGNSLDGAGVGDGAHQIGGIRIAEDHHTQRIGFRIVQSLGRGANVDQLARGILHVVGAEALSPIASRLCSRSGLGRTGDALGVRRSRDLQRAAVVEHRAGGGAGNVAAILHDADCLGTSSTTVGADAGRLGNDRHGTLVDSRSLGNLGGRVRRDILREASGPSIRTARKDTGSVRFGGRVDLAGVLERGSRARRGLYHRSSLGLRDASALGRLGIGIRLDRDHAAVVDRDGGTVEAQRTLDDTAEDAGIRQREVAGAAGRASGRSRRRGSRLDRALVDQLGRGSAFTGRNRDLAHARTDDAGGLDRADALADGLGAHINGGAGVVGQGGGRDLGRDRSLADADTRKGEGNGFVGHGSRLDVAGDGDRALVLQVDVRPALAITDLGDAHAGNAVSPGILGARRHNRSGVLDDALALVDEIDVGSAFGRDSDLERAGKEAAIRIGIVTRTAGAGRLGLRRRAHVDRAAVVDAGDGLLVANGDLAEAHTERTQRGSAVNARGSGLSGALVAGTRFVDQAGRGRGFGPGNLDTARKEAGSGDSVVAASALGAGFSLGGGTECDAALVLQVGGRIGFVAVSDLADAGAEHRNGSGVFATLGIGDRIERDRALGAVGEVRERTRIRIGRSGGGDRNLQRAGEEAGEGMRVIVRGGSRSGRVEIEHAVVVDSGSRLFVRDGKLAHADAEGRQSGGFVRSNGRRLGVAAEGRDRCLVVSRLVGEGRGGSGAAPGDLSRTGEEAGAGHGVVRTSALVAGNGIARGGYVERAGVVDVRGSVTLASGPGSLLDTHAGDADRGGVFTALGISLGDNVELVTIGEIGLGVSLARNGGLRDAVADTGDRNGVIVGRNRLGVRADAVGARGVLEAGGRVARGKRRLIHSATDDSGRLRALCGAGIGGRSNLDRAAVCVRKIDAGRTLGGESLLIDRAQDNRIRFGILAGSGGLGARSGSDAEAGGSSRARTGVIHQSDGSGRAESGLRDAGEHESVGIGPAGIVDNRLGANAERSAVGDVNRSNVTREGKLRHAAEHRGIGLAARIVRSAGENNRLALVNNVESDVVSAAAGLDDLTSGNVEHARIDRFGSGSAVHLVFPHVGNRQRSGNVRTGVELPLTRSVGGVRRDGVNRHR